MTVMGFDMFSEKCIAEFLYKRRVKGRVVDENNAPVNGATVVVKNRPTIGTSTDVKGEFALQGVPKGGGGNSKSLM